MTARHDGSGRMSRFASELGLRRLLLPPVALVALAAGLVMPDGRMSVICVAAGLTLLTLFAILHLLARLHAARGHGDLSSLAAVLAGDPAPVIVTDSERRILHANPAATAFFGVDLRDTLSESLHHKLANPVATLRRMQTVATCGASAQEDLATGTARFQLGVHRVEPDHFIWRFNGLSGDLQAASEDRAALVTVGRSNSILFMNEAARHLVGGRPRSLDSMFDTLPIRPGEVNKLRGVAGIVPVLVLELADNAGRRELMLLPRGDSAGETAEKPPADGPAYFDDLPVPLLMLGPGGRIELANMPARDMLGPSGTAGAQLSDVMEGLGRSLTDWLDEAAAGREPTHSEFLRLSHPDRESYVQVTLKRMPGEHEARLLAVLSDATELKTLEAQFVQSQKMQAIGQLAGGVAHDFNNLLTAISGHCDLLLLRHDPGDQEYGDLIQINQNANRAASLVGQLLAFSRKQTLRPEVLDLRDTLSDLTHLLNRLVGEKVTLSLSHDPLLRTIRADKRQLEQVLMNLVVNSRDAMPNGGEIRIVTESLRLSRPLKRDRAEVAAGEYVSVRVIDTGRGIPADKLTKVFEPFFTTKRIGEGTGLGLSTAYGIVKQTGGFIFADSEPGQGTCFTLLFPVYDPALRVDESDIVDQPEVQHPVHTKLDAGMAEGVVLLVEDEAPVRAFASQALRLRGYTVLEAESAEEALKTLEDGALNVDIFVTDVVMPGMDGPSWVKIALQHRPGVRVVFVSGYAEDSFGDAQAQIPNSVFLPKPFSLKQLTDTVQRQMH
ncbi:response regulator [Pseudooceanicola sp. 216_PA32_1]|uniref:histidine kinase n=1 Tax=Pseudooceanicola pacificus TaxID=2676438 RepID=A0A844W324_9RHOB|nr:ATP-binding protein [Pseudooceanicola pacificus]MWB77485.1 response regulator [Pseudooceanicola pacificus]